MSNASSVVQQNSSVANFGFAPRPGEEMEGELNIEVPVPEMQLPVQVLDQADHGQIPKQMQLPVQENPVQDQFQLAPPPPMFQGI